MHGFTSSMDHAHGRFLGSHSTVWRTLGILIGAGLWQLSPLMGTCLDECRPLGYSAIGARFAWAWTRRVMPGLLLGLMTLLFFGGAMNLYWIVGVAVFVLLEKTIPLRQWLGRIADIVLVAWGILLLT